jgi:tetratricopeptide (TPR) repeat protein
LNHRHPEKTIVCKPLNDQQWAFEYPRISRETQEEFHAAIELRRAGYIAEAEAEYRRLVAEFPEFIDAHHHLAMLLSETGRHEEAYEIWQLVAALGLQALPEAFEIGWDRLPWFVLENRPFLRAYHGLGLAHYDRGDIERALEIFENLLAMNPSDNQGMRALAIDCYFEQGDPESVLEICHRYPEDGLEQVVYGRALALYQLGHKAEAEAALCDAIEWLPLIAKELVKERHRRPKDFDPHRILQGSANQAYFYWRDQGRHWKNTPGALAWVQSSLQTCGDE